MATPEQFILLSIGLFTILVRIWFRWRTVGPSNWQLDDYLMPLTGVSFSMRNPMALWRCLWLRTSTGADGTLSLSQLLFTTEVVAAYLVGAKFDGITNSYMTPEQRANLDHDSREYQNRVWGSKIQVIGWSLYAAILWCLKLCITAVYTRLTYVDKDLHSSVRLYFPLPLTLG